MYRTCAEATLAFDARRREEKLDGNDLKMPRCRGYAENHSFFGRNSSDHRSDDSTSVRRQGGHDPVRKAYVGSSNRDRSGGA